MTDEYGKTALHNAVLGNYLEIVNVLLDCGANSETSDENEETPLHSATRNGNETILKVCCLNYMTRVYLVLSRGYAKRRNDSCFGSEYSNLSLTQM